MTTTPPTPPPAVPTDFVVRLRGSALHFRCAPDTSLLDASAALGALGLRVGCRGGGCGVCRVQIDSGRVRTGRMSRAHVDETGHAAGLVLACRAYPLSDLTLSPAGKTTTQPGACP